MRDALPNWPATHPLLVPLADDRGRLIGYCDADGKPVLDAIADELNRLATLRACWKIVDADYGRTADSPNSERLTFMVVLLIDAVDADPRAVIGTHERLLKLRREKKGGKRA